MTLTAWIAIAVILVTVYCLIKRFETAFGAVYRRPIPLLYCHETDGSTRSGLPKAWQTLRSSWRSVPLWALPMW